MRVLSGVVVLCSAITAVCSAFAKPQSSTQPQASPDKARYKITDDGPYGEILREQDRSRRIVLLDDFVSKNPNSPLLQFIYPLYCSTYGELKNYAKVMEYADKMSALGDKTSPESRFSGLYTWVAAYGQLNSEDAELAASAREHTAAAMKLLPEVRKPQNTEDKMWQEQKAKWTLFLQAAADKAEKLVKENKNRSNP